MAKLRYAILQFDGEWKVVSGTRRMGHFASQALAMHAGARLAREAIAAGHEVEFLVQDAGACLSAHDVTSTTAGLDARQSRAAPADEAPSEPWARALEF